MRAWVNSHRLFVFYLCAFAISWAAWALMYVTHDPGARPTAVTYALSTVGGLGPLLSLGILQRLTSGQVSVRNILGQARLKGQGVRWLVLAGLFYLLITLLGTLGYAAMGRDLPLRLLKSGVDRLGWAALPVMVLHFTASLVTSPLFEEPGWRGFALPQMQRRLGSLGGSLAVALLWWLWHQPMNITFGLLPSWHGLLAMVAFSFIIDALYRLSGDNLLAAMLAHQSSGTAITFLQRAQPNWVSIALLVVLAAALRLAPGARARH